MLKILPCLALFLLVFHVQANAQTHKAHKASESDKPPSPVSPVATQQEGRPDLQPEHQEHVEADVRVVSTPAKDRWDKAAVWINLALAMFGVFGVGAAIYTLRFVKRQTLEIGRQRLLMRAQWREMRRQSKDARESSAADAVATQAMIGAMQDQAKSLLLQANHMVDQKLVFVETLNATRKSAEAALLNAQAIITAERPWLVAHFVRTKQSTVPDDGRAQFQWVVKNVGRTPAVVKEFAARVVFNIDAVPLPEKPDCGDPDGLFSERILIPGGTLRFHARWYEWKDGRYQSLCQPAGSTGVDLLVGFGYVKYGNTFGDNGEYISGFCDSSTIGGALIFGDWSEWTDCPEGYARST